MTPVQEDRLLAFVIATLVTGIMVLVLTQGCSFPPVDVSVGVSLDDECLLTLPVCGGDGYRCVDSDGTEHEECIVACAAGRQLVCDEGEPWCNQYVGHDRYWVPVVCVTP